MQCLTVVYYEVNAYIYIGDVYKVYLVIKLVDTTIRIEKKTKGFLEEYKRNLAVHLRKNISLSGAIQYMLDTVEKPWLDTKQEIDDMKYTAREMRFLNAIRTRNVRWMRDFILEVVEIVWEQFDEYSPDWKCYNLLCDLNQTTYEQIFNLQEHEIVMFFERIRHAMHTSDTFLNSLFQRSGEFSNNFLDKCNDLGV